MQKTINKVKKILHFIRLTMYIILVIDYLLYKYITYLSIYLYKYIRKKILNNQENKKSYNLFSIYGKYLIIELSQSFSKFKNKSIKL